jgi:hypothetical protein
MPISLEPGQTFPIWLESDKDIPMASRPVFDAKAQSMRQQRKVLEVIDVIFKDGVSVEQVFDQTRDCLFDCLAGWRNVPKQLSKESIEDLLTFDECRELLRKCGANQRMSGDEKK